MSLPRLYILQGDIAHQLRPSHLFHLMLSFLSDVLLPRIRCTGKLQETSWPHYSNTFELGSNRWADSRADDICRNSKGYTAET